MLQDLVRPIEVVVAQEEINGKLRAFHLQSHVSIETNIHSGMLTIHRKLLMRLLLVGHTLVDHPTAIL